MSTPLLALSILPALFVFSFFYSRDIYPEPRHTIFKAFILGCIVPCVVVFIFVAPYEFAITSAGPFVYGLSRAFFEAALPEEFGKFLVLWLYCSRNSEFDEPMDGLVYGVTVSLGFAVVENILYVADGGFAVGLMRAFTAIPGHALFGAIMGYYFSVAHFNPQQKLRHYLKALFIPVCFHGLYNFPLMALDGSGVLAGMFLILIFLSALVGGILLSMRLAKRSRALQIQFHAQSLPNAFLVRTPLSKSWRCWLYISLGAALMVFYGVISTVWTLYILLEGSAAVWIIGLALASPICLGGLKLYRTGMKKLNVLDKQMHAELAEFDSMI